MARARGPATGSKRPTSAASRGAAARSPAARRASPGAGKDRPSPRDRLLDAASALFYAEGVHVVGIDRILREAGVAKASLYQHFGSKDGLVRAYLEANAAARRASIEAAVARAGSAREQIVAVLAESAGSLRSAGFRGCHFLNASVEARPDECVDAVTAAFRSWLLQLLTDLADRAGARDPDELGRALTLLHDGVAVAARVERGPARRAASSAALSAVGAILDGALATR